MLRRFFFMAMTSLIIKSFRKAAQAVEDMFFPPLCLHCHTLIETPTDIVSLCTDCLRYLQPVPRRMVRQDVLDRLQPCYLDTLWIAFQFTEAVRSLIHAIKYQQMPRLAVSVGLFIGERVRKELRTNSADLVIPIPLHRTRLKEREFNQSMELAKGIFARQKECIRPELLHRTRYTQTQTKLNRSQREANVFNAFTVGPDTALRERRVILVDDVVTTGSTMNECSRVLKEYGVRHIIGIALATPVEGD